MTQEQIQELALNSIICERQVRTEFDDESLHALMISLEEVGQLQPIRVRSRADAFVVVDGERRYRAAQKAGWKTMSVIVEARELCEGEILQRQLVANCQREDLQSLEKAYAIQRLMEVTGWNAKEAANHLGLSNASVSRTLALLELPTDIQSMVETGKIPASAGYELGRIADPQAQAEYAQQIADGQLTRDALVGVRKSQSATKAESTNAAKPTAARATAHLGAGNVVTVQSADLTLERFIEVLEELLGKSRKARTQGVVLPTFLKMLRDQSRAA